MPLKHLSWQDVFLTISGFFPDHFTPKHKKYMYHAKKNLSSKGQKQERI